MLNEKTFGIFIRNIIAVLTVVVIILMLMLEQRKLYFEPSVLVLQSKFDGVKDRIIKTKSNLSDTEVIFESDNIQDFNATKSHLLVSTGRENQESSLQSVNIQSKETKKIQLAGKFVSEIIGAGDKFVITIEDLNAVQKRDYRKKIAYIATGNDMVVEFNPQFLAANVDDVFVNPSGSLVVFTGVGNTDYIADLDDSQKITKLTSDNLSLIGFINDRQLAFIDYNNEAGTQVVIKDMVTDSSDYINLNGEKFGQLVVSSDSKSVHFTQAKNYKNTAITGIKKLNNQYVFYIPEFSIEKIQLNSDDKFVLFNKRPMIEPTISKGFEYLDKKSFGMYNLELQYLSNNTVSGDKVIWAK
jgi:hypothetical protein